MFVSTMCLPYTNQGIRVTNDVVLGYSSFPKFAKARRPNQLLLLLHRLREVALRRHLSMAPRAASVGRSMSRVPLPIQRTP